MKIPGNLQEIINKQNVHILATSSKGGIPNVIYLTFLKVYDDEHILIADNKFFKTEKNLTENGVAAFLVMDDVNRKAYQLKGSIEMHKEGGLFEEAVKWVKEKKPDLEPKAAVLLTVEEIYSGAEKLSG